MVTRNDRAFLLAGILCGLTIQLRTRKFIQAPVHARMRSSFTVVLCCFVLAALAAGPGSIDWKNWDPQNQNRWKTDINYCSPAQINGQIAGAIYTSDQDALRDPGMGNAGGPAVNLNIYDDANQVYLNGGPDKCDGTARKSMHLPEGYYFFMVCIYSYCE